MYNVSTQIGYNAMISFVWDDEKAQTNLDKHGASFEEAQSVFDDEQALLILSSAANSWVVCHCYREQDVQRQERRLCAINTTSLKQ